MFTFDALNRVLPTQSAVRRPTAQAGDKGGTDALVLGQRLKATVEASLGNGEVIVRIGDASVRMQLPVLAQRGDALDLVLVSREPRLTFSLTAPTQGAEAITTALSDTGRFLDNLMHEEPSPGQSGIASGVPRLLSTPPQDRETLALGLQRAVSESGLFYEAHQALWLDGQKSLASLKREPQANFPLDKSMVKRPVMESATSIPPLQDEVASPIGKDDGLHPDSLNLVRQQLATLETGHFSWQGDAWPGQKLQWDVTEEDAGDSASQHGGAWRTCVCLNLPGLGQVTAQLRLAGTNVQLHVRAESPETILTLKKGTAKLSEQLSAAGVTVQFLQVAQIGNT